MRKAAARKAESAQRVLRRWREGVPNDRMAHLAKDAIRQALLTMIDNLEQDAALP